MEKEDGGLILRVFLGNKPAIESDIVSRSDDDFFVLHACLFRILIGVGVLLFELIRHGSRIYHFVLEGVEKADHRNTEKENTTADIKELLGPRVSCHELIKFDNEA